MTRPSLPPPNFYQEAPVPAPPTQDHVDAHCHASETYHEPVESLLWHMDRNGVGQATLIMFPPDGDGGYHAACVRRHPDRFLAIERVDHNRGSGAAERVDRLADEGPTAIRLHASARSSGDDPLAVWRAAERRGLAVSVAGGGQDYASDALAALVAALPRLPIVIEHMGFHGAIDDATTTAEREANWRKIFALARFPNTSIKIAPLGEHARSVFPLEPGSFPFVRPIPPLLPMALESFGPNRMMWGSDFSCVSNREGYAQSLRLPMAELAHVSDADRAAIFGGVARRVFRLPGV